MNAPLLPEILAVRGEHHPQEELPLAAEGVLRYVCEHRFGSILVAVKGGHAFVNGQVVETALLVTGPAPTSR